MIWFIFYVACRHNAAALDWISYLSTWVLDGLLPCQLHFSVVISQRSLNAIFDWFTESADFPVSPLSDWGKKPVRSLVSDICVGQSSGRLLAASTDFQEVREPLDWRCDALDLPHTAFTGPCWKNIQLMGFQCLFGLLIRWFRRCCFGGISHSGPIRCCVWADSSKSGPTSKVKQSIRCFVFQ